MTKEQASKLIKQKFFDIGFSACGIAKAEPVSVEAVAEIERWLEEGMAAGMDYMYKNRNLRYNPQELFPEAKSIVVVAMNYFPRKIVASDPAFSYYSYGKDYHYVLKSYLAYIIKYIEEEIAPHFNMQLEARSFVDSAPLMEQYWAVKAGVGFRGRNTLVIVPGVGSFCFLGVLALNLDLQYDSPLKISCGKCHRCEEVCPTHAICAGNVDASNCISYQTIENRAEFIPEHILDALGERIYGCDECQKCCPWNHHFARPTIFDEFCPIDFIKKTPLSAIETMSTGDFKRAFFGSPVLRIGRKRLLRNILSVKKWNNRKFLSKK